jgi:hypothetical protein
MRYPKLISQGMEAMLSWPKTGGIIGIPVLRPPGTNDRPTRVVLTRFMIRYYKRAGDSFPRRKSPSTRFVAGWSGKTTYPAQTSGG